MSPQTPPGIGRLEPVFSLHVQALQSLDFCEKVTLPLTLSKRTVFPICKNPLNSSLTVVPGYGSEFDTIVRRSRQIISSAIPTSWPRCLRSWLAGDSLSRTLTLHPILLLDPRY